MKKLLFVVVMAAGFAGASAQKIGYVNFDQIVGAMPETVKAQTQLQDFQQSLQQQAQDMMREVGMKDSIFNVDSAKFSPSMKEIKRKEIFEAYQKAQAFQQQDAQEQLQQKQNELIVPLREKAIAAVKAVAKENNYAYVLEEGTLLVMPPADNIFNLVKAKLGIKDTPAAAPKPAPKRP